MSHFTLTPQHIIVKHYAGSIAYGTNLPTSDVDFRGIFCGNPINIRTPFFHVEEVTIPKEEDTKLYELNKFMSLCLECNPNIIETLWVDENDIVMSTEAYTLLRSHRESLLSSRAIMTHSGYARSQLSRIKGHKKWIMNPEPVDPPRQIDFVSLVQNFTIDKIFKINMEQIRDGYKLIPYGHDIYAVVESEGSSTYSNDFTLNYCKDVTFEERHIMPMYIIKFNKEVYREAKDRHSHFWEWKKNRNEVRSALEEKFTYDTKHAMHLIRLLRMGVELASEGKVNVKRSDAKELLEIREGKWSYDELINHANELESNINSIKTQLPTKPNYELAAKLILQLQDIMWGK